MSTSTQLHRQRLPEGPTGAAAVVGDGPGRVARLRSWLRARTPALVWLLPLLVLSAVVQAVNLGGSPQRIDDEGTYTAQAFAVERFGELTHYTYWYDHPPLGWLQIAAWTGLTGAFERNEVAVVAGREAVLVAHLVSVALLWLLARRLRFSRPAAAAVVLVHALSPLAVQFHRTVFLDNVATPWLLASFVLALTKRHQLAAFAGAAVCFAVAVLSKETYLLFLPFLAWMVWRGAHRGTRRYTVSVAVGMVVLLGLSYLLFALIKGELAPGADRVSLWSGITFQLAGRDGSGSLFDAGSQARVTFGQWLQLDPLLVALTPLAALVALLDRRLRPLAAALVFHLLFMLRPGYLPVPYAIALIPVAALCLVGAVRLLVRAVAGRAGRRRRAGVLVGAVATALLVGVAAPGWGPQLRGLLLADLDQPGRQAQAWIEANVDRDYRLVVDDSMWVDLYRAGFSREDVVWYYKVDTDPEVQALAPNGWSDYDYVVTTNSMRTFPDAFPVVGRALDNSLVVARFGEGERAVLVHRVQPEGIEAARQQADRDAAARVSAGTELARNPAIELGRPERDLLTGGRVDSRVLIGLSRAATVGTLGVADLPAVDAEEAAGGPRRSVLVDEVDGRPLADSPRLGAEVAAAVAQQPEPYRPRSVRPTPDGLLLTWGVDAPEGLLQAGGR